MIREMNQKKRLYLTSALILFFGLVGALLIYLSAVTEARSIMGYDIVNGEAYLRTPENSKKYIHDLKVMGGKAAVYADEFSRWFLGLWHGEALAVTVASFSVVLSFGFFLAARTASAEGKQDRKEDSHP